MSQESTLYLHPHSEASLKLNLRMLLNVSMFQTSLSRVKVVNFQSC